MAIAFVQQVGGASTVAGPTTSTGAVGGTFTAGNLLVAIVNFSSSVAAGADISIPPGWTAPLPMKSNGAPNGNARAYYMVNNPGGAQTWTWTFSPGSGTGQGWAFTIFEFSGAGELDLTAISNATGASASTSLDTLAASGTTKSGGLLVHLVGVDRSAAGTLSTDTTNSVPTTGWSVGTQYQGTNAVPNAHAGGQYQVLSGTQTAPRGVLTSTISESSESFLLTFQPAGAGTLASSARIVVPRGNPFSLRSQRPFMSALRLAYPTPPAAQGLALAGASASVATASATVYQPGLVVTTETQSGITGGPPGNNSTQTTVTWQDLSGNGWAVGMIPAYGGALISPWYELDSGARSITQTSLSTSNPDGFIHALAQSGTPPGPANVFAGTEDPTFTLAEIGPTGQAFRRYYDSGVISTANPALNWRVRTVVYPGDPGHYYHRIDIINPSGSAVNLNGSDGLEIAMLGGLTQASQGGSSAWIPGNGLYATVGGSETAWPGPEPTTTVADPDYVYVTATSGSGLKLAAVCVRAAASNGGQSIAALSGASNAQITYLTNANRLKVKVRVDMSSFPGSTTMTLYYVESRPRNIAAGQAASIAADYLNPDAASIVSVGTAASPFFSLDEGAYVVAASGNVVKLTHTFPTNVTKRWTLNYKITGYTAQAAPQVFVAGNQLDNLSALTYVDTANQIAYVVMMPALVPSGAVAPDLNNGQVVIQQPSGVLAGTSSSLSSGTGTLGIAEAIAGASVGLSAGAATVVIAEALIGATGSVAGASGSLAEQKALASSASAVSSATATVAEQVALSGTTSAISGATGTVTAAGTVALAGGSTSASSTSASLSVAEAIIGSTASVTAASGSLQLLSGLQIAGTSASASQAVGALILQSALAGTSPAQAQFTATLLLATALIGAADARTFSTGVLAFIGIVTPGSVGAVDRLASSVGAQNQAVNTVGVSDQRVATTGAADQP